MSYVPALKIQKKTVVVSEDAIVVEDLTLELKATEDFERLRVEDCEKGEDVPELAAAVAEVEPKRITFDELLSDDKYMQLLRGIFGFGYTMPSKIQAKTIPGFIEGRDILAQSQSGTGKTCAFVVGGLIHVNTAVKNIQMVILAPTRELAEQISCVTKEIGRYMKVKIVVAIGGVHILENKKDSVGAHVLIGTVGRTADLVKKRVVDLSRTKVFIIDEVDQMMDDSFRESLLHILKVIPPSVLLALFSATMKEDTKESISDMLKDGALTVLIEPENLSLDGITQFKVEIDNNELKFDTMLEMFLMITFGGIIIYVNSTKTLTMLDEKLKFGNYSVGTIHGKMPQAERMEVLKKFRNRETRILISTDLLSRGIDVQSVTVVINFDIPDDYETYLHRVGRVGRYGRKGLAINFFTKRDQRKLDLLAEYFGIEIKTLTDNFMDALFT
jgi:superfamily II DNA/RNA helicase